MLHIIGLGLSDEKDITIKGLEAIRGSSRVYLEGYTSILGIDKARLEEFYGKSVEVADRDMVETESDKILADADKVDVSFLVVGDPLGATTHIDLLLRADEQNIKWGIIHNASIMNAVAATGLVLYNFGQTISIPFFTDNWRPTSWLARVYENSDLGLHTLALLDIKVKEQSEENLARGRKIFEPPRYMSVPVALEQLIWAVENDTERDPARRLKPEETLAVSVSRVGDSTQKIAAGTVSELAGLSEDFYGGPLHSIALVGPGLHSMERDFCLRYAVNPDSWRRVCADVYKVRD